MNTDPFVRYVAGSVVVIFALGAMAIVVHGYWLSDNYRIPAEIVGVLTAILSGAFTILGVHIGTASSAQAIGQSAEITQQTVKQIQNGASHP